MMGRQPFQEHFLLLRELNDRMLLSIQGRDEFKDTIREPLRAMLGIDPVVIGLQRRHVRLIGWGHEVDELGAQTSGDRQGWCRGLIDRYELIGHKSLRGSCGTRRVMTSLRHHHRCPSVLILVCAVAICRAGAAGRWHYLPAMLDERISHTPCTP